MRVLRNRSTVLSHVGAEYIFFSPSLGLGNSLRLHLLWHGTLMASQSLAQKVSFPGKKSRGSATKFIGNTGFPHVKLQAAPELGAASPTLKSAWSKDPALMAACKCLFQEGKLL